MRPGSPPRTSLRSRSATATRAAPASRPARRAGSRRCTVATIRTFRSAASTEGGALDRVVTACSAARRARTGLDRAAQRIVLLASSVFGGIGGRCNAVEALPAGVGGFVTFSQVGRSRRPDTSAERGRMVPSNATRAPMTDLRHITDPEDPRVADYVDLNDPELRKGVEAAAGFFVAESPHVIVNVARAGRRFRSVLVTPKQQVALAEVLATLAVSRLRRRRSGAPAGRRLQPPSRRGRRGRPLAVARPRRGARPARPGSRSSNG